MLRRASARAVAAVSGALSLGVLPVFLVGALADRIGDDLGFGAGGTGVVIAVFFTAAGLGGIPLGMVSDRIGARRGIRLGIAVSAGAGVITALWVGSFWQLAAVMAVSGSVLGLIDTGAARLISDVIRVRRQGMAFGIKEASVPAASMLAGGSIPLVVEPFGWRPMFAAGLIPAPVLWVLLPDAGESHPDHDRVGATTRTGPLFVFASGVALAVGAATAAATFLVPAATALSTMSVGVAGVTLALASVASIFSRIGFGQLSDRRPGLTTSVMVGAVAVGAVGAGVLAMADATALVAVGAVLVLGAGWGWTGLAFLTAVRATPGAPSTAAGVVLAGLSAGGVAGPALYGAIVSVSSYRAAWVAVAAAMVAGAALIHRADIG